MGRSAQRRAPLSTCRSQRERNRRLSAEKHDVLDGRASLRGQCRVGRKSLAPSLGEGIFSVYFGLDLVMTNNLPAVCVLLADRSYDAVSIRQTIGKRDVLPVIPMRKSRKKRVGTDSSLCCQRKLVERCFNKLKNTRRVAARYDKTAKS